MSNMKSTKNPTNSFLWKTKTLTIPNPSLFLNFPDKRLFTIHQDAILKIDPFLDEILHLVDNLWAKIKLWEDNLIRFFFSTMRAYHCWLEHRPFLNEGDGVLFIFLLLLNLWIPLYIKNLFILNDSFIILKNKSWKWIIFRCWSINFWLDWWTCVSYISSLDWPSRLNSNLWFVPLWFELNRYLWPLAKLQWKTNWTSLSAIIEKEREKILKANGIIIDD